MTEIEIDGIRIVIDGEQIKSPQEVWNLAVATCYTPDTTGLLTPEYQMVMMAVQKYGAKIISGDVLEANNNSVGMLY